MAMPYMAPGIDRAWGEIKQPLGKALTDVGAAYIGRTRLDGARWLQLVVAGEDAPDPAADGHIHAFRDGFRPFAVRRGEGDRIVGLAVRQPELETAIPFALASGIDLLLLDATPGIAEPWSELH